MGYALLYNQIKDRLRLLADYEKYDHQHESNRLRPLAQQIEELELDIQEGVDSGLRHPWSLAILPIRVIPLIIRSPGL